MDISIIIPVLNEQGNITPLYNSLLQAVPRKYSWEILLIDDGSTDGSKSEIRELCRTHSNVKALFFSKNFGHQIALSAGYDHAAGRAVITMDCDLQHPPESLPEMIRLWEEGGEIIFAVRNDEEHLPAFKKITSAWFYAILKKISHLDLIAGAADFRLLDRKVVDYLCQYKERDRFLRGIISDMGFCRKILRYNENPRQRGTSKYNMGRMFKLALAGVISFSSFPLKLCSLLGFIISIASFTYAGIIIYDKVVHGAIPGMASVLVGVFFIGGVQLIFIGILGEYLVGVFKEVKARPLYCITERI
jgi:dolichol-phosphate mannosyltransferase